MSATTKVEFVPGQFYFGETEVEIGGMEIRVQYHFLPNDPEEFPYNVFEAQEVHFKDVHLKYIQAGVSFSSSTWIDVKDLLEEAAQGDLEDQLQAKLDGLMIEYVPNDRPVDE